MAQPIPSLIDIELEHNKLTLEDLGPLSHYWMILKCVFIYPGVDTFEVAPCKIGEDGAVYIMKNGKQVAQFSTKDAEVWNFLFYYIDQVYFKSFEDSKPYKINGREPYLRGYLAVKITN